VRPYFSLKALYKPELYAGRSEDAVCQIIDNALLESISRRIPKKGSVGVALSGGVDSGYIAQKLVAAGADITGYNLSYKDSYDEFDRIDILAEALGIEVRKIIISPDQAISNFEEANSFSSEPMGFNNATMQFVALEAQRDGVDTLFDGDGADRLFLGMVRYLAVQKAVRTYLFFKKFGLIPLIRSLLRFAPTEDFNKLYKHFTNWDKGIPPYTERAIDSQTRYDLEYEKRIYEIGPKRYRELFEREIGQDDFGLFITYQAIFMCPEMFFYDPAEIQTRLGLFPVPAFWDDDLVSLALSLPTDWKLRQGKTKYILRKAAARNLDENYWMLPKIGLQDSFSYVDQSEQGRKWRDDLRMEVSHSNEYQVLAENLPGKNIHHDRLIGLIIWKKYNNIA